MTGFEVLLMFGAPWIILGLLRAWRAFKNPDYRDTDSILSRRYVDNQFKKPPNEGDLL